MLKYFCGAALATMIAASGIAPAFAADTKIPSVMKPSTKKEDLLIYHVEGRRSQRVIWLCEELGIPYTVIFKRGDVGGSFKTIRDTFPDMAVAPTIVYQGKTMIESGAIIEYLQSQYGKGRLEPDVNSTDFLYHMQWLHFTEGSALPMLFQENRGGRFGAIGPAQNEPMKPRNSFRVGTPELMAFIEDHLSKHPYFGGEQFTTADLMMHFVASLAPDPNYFSIDMSKYPHFAAWQKKVESRPGYAKAMNVALPDHQPSQCRFPSCNPPQKN